MQESIAVIGLGYVGLPVAISLAKKFDNVTGFDISQRRISALQSGHDWTGEISDADMAATSLSISSDPNTLNQATFFIVTVPTPIDAENRPDLSPIRSSCELIGPRMQKDTMVVFESTVYPGVTEDICGPLLEELSGLKQGFDFFLGYSPERINPGDQVHRLESIIKIVSAEDEQSLQRAISVYGAIIDAGLHVAPTIKVAEAAKVIENTQRDLNIALMNEIALIFDRMDINTKDVLAAAGTKWNFLPFTPGLVGGHCIGVDPYYLTNAAERFGYRPEVILAGRRVNDQMGAFVARQALKLLLKKSSDLSNAKVGVLGLTFKENVPDLRNSKVPDIVKELAQYNIAAKVHDPLANPKEAMHEYGIQLSATEEMTDMDILILAVDHDYYLSDSFDIEKRIAKNGSLVDVKSAVDAKKLCEGQSYWSL